MSFPSPETSPHKESPISEGKFLQGDGLSDDRQNVLLMWNPLFFHALVPWSAEDPPTLKESVRRLQLIDRWGDLGREPTQNEEVPQRQEEPE